jgi:hypothetical protein
MPRLPSLPLARLLAVALVASPAFAGIVTGTVKNASGVGVSGVVVSVAGGGVSFTTGVTGAFTITVAAGTYVLDVAPPKTGTPLYAATQVFDVVVGAGTTNVGVLTLQDGVVLTGSVQTTLGAPLAAADTDVFVAGTGLKLFTPGDNTNASGVYSVVVPAGTYDVVGDAPAGLAYVSTKVANVVVAAVGTTTAPTIQLPSGWFLSGVVASATTNLPIPDVNLDVDDQFTGVRILTPNDITDASGAFSIVVPSGFFRVSFKPAPGALFVAKQIEFVPVFSNFATGTTTLQPGTMVSGTVLGPGGVPAAGADVDVDAVLGSLRMFTPYDTTSATGAYAVVVPPGTYVISSDGGPNPTWVAGALAPLVVGTSPVVAPTINLQQGVVLSGVLNGWNGLPETQAFVKVAHASTGANVIVPENTTSATGAYAVAVPPGTYDVTFTPKNLSLSRTKTFTNVVVNGPTTFGPTLPMVQVAAYMVPSPGQPTQIAPGQVFYVDLAIFHPNPFTPAPVADVSLTFVDPAGNATALLPTFLIPMSPGQFVVGLSLPWTPPSISPAHYGFPSRLRFAVKNAATGIELDADEIKFTIN